MQTSLAKTGCKHPTSRTSCAATLLLWFPLHPHRPTIIGKEEARLCRLQVCPKKLSTPLAFMADHGRIYCTFCPSLSASHPAQSPAAFLERDPSISVVPAFRAKSTHLHHFCLPGRRFLCPGLQQIVTRCVWEPTCQTAVGK